MHHIQKELHAELKLLHQIYFFFHQIREILHETSNFYTKLEIFSPNWWHFWASVEMWYCICMLDLKIQWINVLNDNNGPAAGQVFNVENNFIIWNISYWNKIPRYKTLQLLAKQVQIRLSTRALWHKSKMWNSRKSQSLCSFKSLFVIT